MHPVVLSREPVQLCTVWPEHERPTGAPSITEVITNDYRECSGSLSRSIVTLSLKHKRAKSGEFHVQTRTANDADEATVY